MLLLSSVSIGGCLVAALRLLGRLVLRGINIEGLLNFGFRFVHSERTRFQEVGKNIICLRVPPPTARTHTLNVTSRLFVSRVKIGTFQDPSKAQVRLHVNKLKDLGIPVAETLRRGPFGEH